MAFDARAGKHGRGGAAELWCAACAPQCICARANPVLVQAELSIKDSTTAAESGRLLRRLTLVCCPHHTLARQLVACLVGGWYRMVLLGVAGRWEPNVKGGP